MEIILGVCLLLSGIIGYTQYESIQSQKAVVEEQKSALEEQNNALAVQVAKLSAKKTVPQKINDVTLDGATIVNLSGK